MAVPLMMVAAVCAAVPGLVSQQLKVCEGHPNAMLAVSEGTRRGITECQSQFANERWNCTPDGFSNTVSHHPKIFGQTLQRGNKETAFLYAITSAGVVHAVTEACSAGNLTDCSCDRSRVRDSSGASEGWKWGGCSDNVRYGIMFARQFVDAPDRLERKKTGEIRSLMNLHNNHAGRLAVANLMELKCRCHGISGSCELKTCWRTLPNFNAVGKLLKEQYNHAEMVTPKNTRNRQKKKGNKVKRKVLVNVRKDELVYVQKSPNYCIEDTSKAITGTTGRVCSRTSDGPDNCSLLCCGRGYNTKIKRQSTRCDCKFEWCCNVQCNVCETETEVYTCK